MSKRKGVTAEEKRNRMLQLFHEKKDFFQLKELEKIAPKEKGIIAQSVKDVVQSLVDDGLVDTDKIGCSTYYWAYPSSAINSKKRKLNELEQQLDQARKKLEKTKEALEAAKLGREDTTERQTVLKEIEELNKTKNELDEKLKKHKDYDPQTLEKLKSEIEDMKCSVNRWTDNIFIVKTWCKNKFMIEGDVLDKQFGIPSDLDYID